MLFYRKKSRGIITVFVTLILVPVIVCTGTLVDLARMKLYSSQAAMASDMYSEAVLTEYDYVLKELYGLFAITQNETAKAEVEALAETYAKCTFNPNADESVEIGGWMPYKDAEVSITSVAVAGASLCNTEGGNAVLSTQIGDFMKFRIVQQVIEEMKILDILDGFENMPDNMDAIETRADMSDSSEKALELIGEYYSILKLINAYKDYKAYKEGLIDRYAGLIYSAYLTKDIEDGPNAEEYAYDYEDYLDYLNNKDDIDEAVKKVEEAQKKGETVDEDIQSLADRYMDVDKFKEHWNAQFDGIDTSAEGSYGIKFGEVSKKISELESKASEITEALVELRQQITVLEGKLETCDPALSDSIHQEIEDLEDIVAWAECFQDVVDDLNSNQNGQKDSNNKTNYENKIEDLNNDKELFLKGELKDYTLNNSVSFDWYNFYEDYKEFYDFLVSLCGGSNSDGSGKGEDDVIKENAQKEIDGALTKMDEDDKPTADGPRNMNVDLIFELGSFPQDLSGSKASSSLDGCTSFANIGTMIVNKFLLTSYDFGMFSSRVSGIEKPDDDSEDNIPNGGTSTPAVNSGSGASVAEVTEQIPTSTNSAESSPNITEEDEEYYDESLTGYKMSKDINYLYGAELEYIIGGSGISADNLKHTRNIIFGVRMATNFISTYTIKEINQPISSIANSAASAVAGTGFGAAIAPLIRVLVSGALRLMVATLESVADWDALKKREDVLFFKNSMQDLQIKDTVLSILGGTHAGLEKVTSKDTDATFDDDKSMSLDIKLSYEDYVYIILLCMTGEEDQLRRTADLITLNVNQYEQGSPKELTKLDFKMTETQTAIMTTCEVDMEFMFVPENMLNIFLGDDSEAEQIMEHVNESTYGYTMIRGY